ncbi:unnamed protein product [Symbiodinium microadriaticum]|nr:unnamed protein product [Symbiodinium microadriaticum]
MRPDPSSHEKLSGGDLDCSTTTDDGMVAGEISPWLRSFAERYFLRLHGVAFMPSAENLAEATRCFHLIAANYQMQASAKQSAVSTSEGWTDAANSSSKTAGTVHAHVPLDFLRGHLSMMMQKGLHSGGQGSNQHFDDRLDRMLHQMDGDGDGSITLVEFLDAFVLLPCDQVPLEFDFQAIASAELVACILCELGLLPESALQSSVFFHPQSFSASATHSLLSHAFSADAKNRLRLNNIKQCAVVTSDMIDCAGIKFGADALLKAKLS